MSYQRTKGEAAIRLRRHDESRARRREARKPQLEAVTIIQWKVVCVNKDLSEWANEWVSKRTNKNLLNTVSWYLGQPGRERPITIFYQPFCRDGHDFEDISNSSCAFWKCLVAESQNPKSRLFFWFVKLREKSQKLVKKSLRKKIYRKHSPKMLVRA